MNTHVAPFFFRARHRRLGTAGEGRPEGQCEHWPGEHGHVKSNLLRTRGHRGKRVCRGGFR